MEELTLLQEYMMVSGGIFNGLFVLWLTLKLIKWLDKRLTHKSK